MRCWFRTIPEMIENRAAGSTVFLVALVVVCGRFRDQERVGFGIPVFLVALVVVCGRFRDQERSGSDGEGRRRRVSGGASQVGGDPTGP